MKSRAPTQENTSSSTRLPFPVAKMIAIPTPKIWKRLISWSFGQR